MICEIKVLCIRRERKWKVSCQRFHVNQKEVSLYMKKIVEKSCKIIEMKYIHDENEKSIM